MNLYDNNKLFEANNLEDHNHLREIQEHRHNRKHIKHVKNNEIKRFRDISPIFAVFDDDLG